MRTIIITTIWIWVMSLVERVMSDAVENLSNSVLEKFSTRSNTMRRRLRARPADVLAARKPTAMVHAPESSDSSSIIIPTLRI